MIAIRAHFFTFAFYDVVCIFLLLQTLSRCRQIFSGQFVSIFEFNTFLIPLKLCKINKERFVTVK